MRRKAMLWILCVLFLSLHARSQGWQHFGPDSSGWQYAGSMTGHWSSPTSFRLVVMGGSSITTYATGTGWNYKLRAFPGNPHWPGSSYDYGIVSPWETDSLILGYSMYFTEPQPLLIKIGFPPVYAPSFNGFSGYHWIYKFGFVVPPGSDSTIFASMAGILRSDDRGSTWNYVTRDTTGSRPALLSTDRHSPSVLYKEEFSTGGSTLYRSRNYGISWDSLYAPMSDWWFVDRPAQVIAQGDTILLSLSPWPLDTLTAKGILRSSDGGSSWSHVYSATRSGGIAFSHLSSSRIFAATESGILISDDFGLTWSVYNNSLPTTKVTDLLVDPYSDTLYVSSETHGVLKAWNYLVGAGHEEKELPIHPVLYQNYPNPFNPTTEIRYQTSEVSHVTLKIYDFLGREVATLVNGRIDPGTYSATWNATGFASGVYLYRMQAGSFVEAKKLVLLR